MNFLELLYDDQEKAKVRFVGFITEMIRYDFGIIYSSLFFGKPLVVCMQTGRSALLDTEDLEDIDTIQKAFTIQDRKQASDLIEFFKSALPNMSLQSQYE